MQSAASVPSPVGFHTAPEASTTKKGNVPCGLRREHSEQGAGTLAARGMGRPEGTGVRTVPALLGPGRQEAVMLQARFSVHSDLYHDFKTCFPVSCALFCPLVAMEKWVGARSSVLLCQHCWTHQLPSAPVQMEGSQDGTCSQVLSLRALVLWLMSPLTITAFIHALA